MGRRTWDSIGRPLPDRTNLVLSRSITRHLPGAQMMPGLPEALARAQNAGETESFVIGGAALYAEALPLADRIYLTRVHAEPDGDVFLPPLDASIFEEQTREVHPADSRHPFSFTFLVLERRGEKARPERL